MAIKKMIRSLKKTTIFIIKSLLFISLFVVFFGLFSIDHPQIIDQTRTAAITMTTFVIIGISMTAVYGGFAIGKKKSKDIISSLGIAAFITDAVTYLQLCIMNTHSLDQRMFTLKSIGILLVIFILHLLIVTIFVYFGNYVYFRINPPEKCVLICFDEASASEILPKIGKYKKQYKVTDVISFKDPNLRKLIRHSDSIFIYNVPAQDKSDIIDYAYKHYVNVYLNAELSDIVVNYSKHNVLDDMPMLVSNIKGLSFEQKFLKRTIDIIISSVALIVFSPIMLIEALCIKLYDKGPVFFKQERATLNGKIFNVLKFRTMIVDADKKEGYRPASDHDDRITPVGNILRKLRIDELPQLINILIGDMSVVGPRPERIEHVEKYENDLPEFRYRLRAKAGLTGLAQIAGKYNTTPKDKLILDLMYIEKYSVWQDIVIMFQTVKVFFKSDSTEGFTEESIVEFVKHQEQEHQSTDK
ncbi:sugar transferase [Paludicola sp. MB14-C6]|uniref:sugar transferase n=1 Tax=Paludihabitans sp. MB14-C6 TaxID=3070656 RepID=UPI0027DE780E|nr:sugar transferase [Paludicola sp. MB14-C6]WMJ23971.1 sugar transferase [Paludicola sp. MB14-C6]